MFPFPPARLRTLLAIGYALFIGYASLSPFSGWREQGIVFVDVLRLPLNSPYTLFDVILNFVSYIPFGLLVGLTLRARHTAITSAVWAVLLGILLSAGMEYLQMYLPRRTSSNLDLLMNSMGMACGAVLAVSITSWTGWFAHLTHWRNRLFHPEREMDFGLAILALWMFGQINPTLPMLGNLFIHAVAQQPFVTTTSTPFNSMESLTVMLNLLMVGVLLITLLRIPRHIGYMLLTVLGGVALVKFVTAAVLLKSSALLLWINSEAMLGIACGMILLSIGVRLPRRQLIYLGAIITLSYFTLVNQDTPHNSPASSMTIYQWNQGHLRNYNGLAQTISLIFPVLLLFHLWRVRLVTSPSPKK